MKNINFFSTSDNERYNMFIVPHILSVLYHIENSYVEIVVKDGVKFKKENADVLSILYEEFSGRFLIRQMSNEYDGIKYPHIGQIVRFLDKPYVKCDYTYIGDIDIIVLDKDVTSTHEKLMSKQENIYSNIIRKDTKRLTGCMFLKTKEYYEAVRPIIKKFLKEPSNVYYPILNDEILLYHLVKPNLDLPKHNSGDFRPIHGIHISLNRPDPLGNKEDNIPGWGINEKRLEQYKAFRNSHIFRKIEPFFEDEFKGFIKILDKIKNEDGRLTL